VIRSICLFVFTLLAALGGADAQTPPPKRIPVTGSPEFMQAQILESQGKYDEAIALYRSLYEKEKTDNAFWKVLILLERTDAYDEMERMVLKRLEGNPEDISVRKYLARAYYGQGKKEAGRATLLNILGDRWSNLGILYLVSGELIHQDDLETALYVYLTAREKLKKPELFAHEVARIYTVRMQYVDALEEYVRIMENIKTAYQSAQEMILKAKEAGVDREDIERPLAFHLERHQQSIMTARLLCDLRYGYGDYDGAHQAIVPSAVVSQSPGDVWDLAERFRRDGLLEEALAVFEDYYRYFDDDPRRVSALLSRAGIRSSMGDREAAAEEYRRIERDYEGTLESDVAALRRIELERDRMSAEAFTGRLGDFAVKTKYREVAREAWLLRGNAFLRNGRPEEARESFKQAAVKSRSKRERYDVAVMNVLTDFFTVDFETMAMDIEYCVSMVADGDAINDLLELKVLGLSGESDADANALSAYAQGHYALFRGETGRAAELFARAAVDSSSTVASPAARMLAQIALSSGNAEEAVSWYLAASRSARFEAGHAGALARAADIVRETLNDPGRAASLYREALVAFPNNVHEYEIRRKLRELVTE